MRRAGELERRRLNETFAALCAIRSPFGEERAIADHVTGELRAMGLAVEEDGTRAQTGCGAGNLLARIPGRDPDRHVLLCAHLDTVEHEGVVEPVLDDGAWVSRGDTILGADNKAAVAVLVEVARRVSVEGAPVGLELLLTVGEERALAGATAFDASVLRARTGYVLDHASPIGEVVTASPTYFRLEAHFRGRAAHAGIRPEDGRSAIRAAARAVAAMPHGRLDPETTVNVGGITGGASHTNVVPERCTVLAEVRSLDPRRAEDAVGAVVDAVHDAANEPECPVDADVVCEKLFAGYRRREDDPAVQAAFRALRACGWTPRAIATGGGSDANALLARGIDVVNLANGTEHNHEPTERVTQAALEGMLDVVLCLLEEV